MTRFLFGDLLWPTIEGQAKKAQSTRAAIAYVTRVPPLRFRSGDLLIVDATDDAIASGRTAAMVLSKLNRMGVRLFSHAGLHAKCVVVDSVLFTSSANLSSKSVDDLLEAGIQTDSPNSVSEAVALLERLTKRSTKIDNAFIDRIKRIKVKRSPGGERSTARKVSKDQRQAVTWLVGVHDIDEPTDPDELKRIEEGRALAEKRRSNDRSKTAWIRMPRNGLLAKGGREGDSLILIDRSSLKANPERVYRNTTILNVQPEPDCIRVYYEDLPYAKRRSLTWGQFKRLAKLARIPGKLSKDSERQLSQKISDDLNDHWDQARAK
jgi:hypothetical protein